MSRIALILATMALAASACGGRESASPRDAGPAAPAPGARSLLIVTIDTLRADRVGVYGLASARTPTLDRLAREGARFDRAYAPAPITLPSHASLLTGRYPPGHASRHNGQRARDDVPTLAAHLRAAGFATAAFVSAFPLDRRFGLARGFDVYDDRLPRASDGRPLNERPGRETVARASAWLQAHLTGRFFLWVHLFEPHAPYAPLPGPAGSEVASPIARYDGEVTTADAVTGDLLSSLGPALATTLVVVAGDHGEAFGEHGEIGHSVFVYDTTLRIPLLVRGPGVPPGLVVADAVSLIDLPATVLAQLNVAGFDTDGVDVSPALRGATLGERTLYAESFAPLLDFGWSSLRTLRDGRWKYIAAPRAELYDVIDDPDEHRNRVSERPSQAQALQARVDGMSGPELTNRTPAVEAEAASRLRSLGYVGGGVASRAAKGPRPDPKDRVQIAARLAYVLSGESQGREAIALLEAVLRDDPQNPQAHLRLGYAWLDQRDCGRATPHLRAAIAAGLPSADPYLGLAGCLAAADRFDAAMDLLRTAKQVEPENPVVVANLGLMTLETGRAAEAVGYLTTALEKDPDLHQARFGLARALARIGRRAEAADQARELLRRLPTDAPQQTEVERLLTAVR